MNGGGGGNGRLSNEIGIAGSCRLFTDWNVSQLSPHYRPSRLQKSDVQRIEKAGAALLSRGVCAECRIGRYDGNTAYAAKMSKAKALRVLEPIT